MHWGERRRHTRAIYLMAQVAPRSGFRRWCVFQGRRDGGAHKLTTEGHHHCALLAAPAAHARPRWRLLSWLVRDASLKTLGKEPPWSYQPLAAVCTSPFAHLSLCPSSSIQSRHLAPAQGFPIPREASLCPISHPDCSRLLPPFRLSDPDVPVLNAIPFESC